MTLIPQSKWHPAYRHGEPAERMDKAIWCASDDDPEEVSAFLVSERCNRDRRQPHVVWNPVSGDLFQMIDLDYQCRWWPKGHEANDAFTILAVCDPAAGFAHLPCRNIDRLIEAADGLQIPRVFPAGPPRGYTPRRSVLRLSGHYGASQIPGVADLGPGPIITTAITGVT